MVKCKSLLYYPTWLFEKSEICGLHACGKYHHMGANSERTFSRRIELSWQRAGWIICACIVLLMVISCHNSCLPKSVLHGLGYPRGKNTCTLRAICDLKHTDEELNKSIWGDLKRSTRTFNSSSRSPCWIDSISGRYRCLPGLMLIGNPKCGTTDVFERAIQHPLLARSRHKEPHWFTRHISLQSFDGARGNGTHGRGYLQNWDADDVRRGDLLTFEASPSTLWDLGRIRVSQQHSSGVLVPEGLRYLLGSRVKFVVCLCDPSRRMLSDYLAIGVRAYVDDIKRAAGARLDGNKTEQLTQGLQSPAYFHRHVTSAISHFERCEQRLTLLECLYVEPYQLHTPRPWLAVGAAAHFLQVLACTRVCLSLFAACGMPMQVPVQSPPGSVCVGVGVCVHVWFFFSRCLCVSVSVSMPVSIRICVLYGRCGCDISLQRTFSSSTQSRTTKIPSRRLRKC
eukprot:m.499352 g.499352  ORF g.499352 m.499352 type:complete len:454 (+) comp21825_c0_seq21:27-1388(+)